MKVHFAGLENKDFACVLIRCAGVRYGLFSVYYFIGEFFGLKPVRFKYCVPDVGAYLHKNCAHSIMDSGIFTLMLGAESGRRDRKFLDTWQDKILEFVEVHKYPGTVVEVDCQKILGVNDAWQMREQLRTRLPKHQVINVYHTEDGKEGLDRLIEFSDYLALSIPEAKKTRIPNLPEYLYRQACYIKSKKPDIKIHLLCCTDSRIMRKLHFCDSCDSTSWQQVNRYGTGVFIDPATDRPEKIGRTAYERNAVTLNEKTKIALAMDGMEPIGKKSTYYSNYWLNCLYLKNLYEKSAGPQD